MAYLLGGPLVIRDEPEWSEDREGWDELHHNKVVRATSPQLALLAARFTLGSTGQITGSTNMVCVRRRAKIQKWPYWEVTGEYKGIAGVKPYKRTLRTFPDKSRGTVSRVSGGVPYVQEIELNENLVGVTVQYVSHNPPNTSWVGYPAYPVGGGVSVPQPHWQGLTNPLEIIPSGWVLDGIEAEELPGSRMCLVRMDYVYYQQYKPSTSSS